MKLRDIRRRAKTKYIHESGFRFIREHGRFVYTDAELWYYMLNLKIERGLDTRV